MQGTSDFPQSVRFDRSSVFSCLAATEFYVRANNQCQGGQTFNRLTTKLTISITGIQPLLVCSNAPRWRPP